MIRKIVISAVFSFGADETALASQPVVIRHRRFGCEQSFAAQQMACIPEYCLDSPPVPKENNSVSEEKCSDASPSLLEENKSPEKPGLEDDAAKSIWNNLEKRRTIHESLLTLPIIIEILDEDETSDINQIDSHTLKQEAFLVFLQREIFTRLEESAALKELIANSESTRKKSLKKVLKKKEELNEVKDKKYFWKSYRNGWDNCVNAILSSKGIEDRILFVGELLLGAAARSDLEFFNWFLSLRFVDAATSRLFLKQALFEALDSASFETVKFIVNMKEELALPRLMVSHKINAALCKIKRYTEDHLSDNPKIIKEISPEKHIGKHLFNPLKNYNFFRWVMREKPYRIMVDLDGFNATRDLLKKNASRVLSGEFGPLDMNDVFISYLYSTNDNGQSSSLKKARQKG